MLIFVFYDYFITENPVTGFAFISSLIVIFSGIQIFLIGIMGKYVARIFLNSSSITIDIIKEETEFV